MSQLALDSWPHKRRVASTMPTLTVAAYSPVSTVCCALLLCAVLPAVWHLRLCAGVVLTSTPTLVLGKCPSDCCDCPALHVQKVGHHHLHTHLHAAASSSDSRSTTSHVDNLAGLFRVSALISFVTSRHGGHSIAVMHTRISKFLSVARWSDADWSWDLGIRRQRVTTELDLSYTSYLQ